MEFADPLAHGADVVVREVRVHRRAQDLVAYGLRGGICALFNCAA
jgi:hypothetical protein